MNYTHDNPNLDDDIFKIETMNHATETIIAAALLDINRCLGEIANLLQTMVRNEVNGCIEDEDISRID